MCDTIVKSHLRMYYKIASNIFEIRNGEYDKETTTRPMSKKKLTADGHRWVFFIILEPLKESENNPHKDFIHRITISYKFRFKQIHIQ